MKETADFPERTDTQSDFDAFNDMAISLLEQFYPKRTVTLSSRDPYFFTPLIKAKLRMINRLMQTGRTEEAIALAQRIDRDIANRNKLRLSPLVETWSKVWGTKSARYRRTFLPSPPKCEIWRDGGGLILSSWFSIFNTRISCIYSGFRGFYYLAEPFGVCCLLQHYLQTWSVICHANDSRH